MAFNPRRIIGPTSSVDNSVPRFDGTTGRILQNSSNIIISDDGYLSIGNLTPQTHLDVSGALSLRGLAASPAVAPAGQGRIYFDTATNKFRISESGGSYSDLLSGIGGGGANLSLSNLTTTSINQSLIPATDRALDLGTSALRWRDLYLGPDSLNIITKAIETGTARSWALGIAETFSTTQGRLTFKEGSNEYLNISPAGNIGIGITETAEKLHILAGISNVGLRIDSASSNPTVLQLKTSSTLTSIVSTFAGASSNKPLQFEVGGSPRLFLNTNGNIGIGTTVPSSILHIESNSVAGLTSKIVNLNSGNAAYSELSAISNSSGVSLRAYSSTYNATSAWALPLTDSTHIFSDVSSSRLYISTLAAAPLYIGTNSNFGTAPSLEIDGNSNVLFNSSLANIDFRISGTTQSNLLFVDASANAIGLGNSNPNSILDISGDLNQRGIAAPALSLPGQGKIYFDSTSNTFKVSQDGGSFVDLLGGGGSAAGSSGAIQFNVSNLLGADTVNFFWDNLNKRLGIGTNAPSQALEVYGSVDDKLLYKAYNSNNTASASAGFAAFNGAGDSVSLEQYSGGNAATIFGRAADRTSALTSFSGSSFLVGTTSFSDLIFGTNDTERMIISAGGNIGIGTTSPTQKFHLVGSALIDGSIEIFGSAKINGITTNLNSETVNIADSSLYLNNGYITPVPQTGGLIINYLPTAIFDYVTSDYTPGVSGTSNPYVVTLGANTFVPGTIIQISDSEFNDGIYEVLSHASNVLEIRGIGLTDTVEDFTQKQFTYSFSDSARITKVNVSVIRVGLDGIWESASGSTTPLFFTDFSSADALFDGELATEDGYILGSEEESEIEFTGIPYATRNFSNLQPTVIRVNLDPVFSDGYNIGSPSYKWRDGYFTRTLFASDGYFTGRVKISNSTLTAADAGAGSIRWSGSQLELSDGITWTGINANEANRSLSNLFTTAINTDLLPGLDATYNLGSDILRWKDGYFASNSLHIGNSLADEAALIYNSSTLQLGLSGTAVLAISSTGVGIGNLNPTAALSIGTFSELEINSAGNFSKINNIPISFPSIQGTTNTVLTNDGYGSLTWETPLSVLSAGVSNEIAIWSGAKELTSYSSFTHDGSTLSINSSAIVNNNNSAGSFLIKGTLDNNLFTVDYTSNAIGIGTTTPNEKLTVESSLALAKTAAPSPTPNYGKLFVSPTDGYLFYSDEVGNQYNLVAPKSTKSPIATVVSDYFVVTSDGTILADAFTGNINITLPPASSVAEYHFKIKKIDISPNLVFIIANGIDKIDGASNYYLNTQYETITVQSDGTNWWIV